MIANTFELPRKHRILGLGISELKFDEAVNLFLKAAATRQKVRAVFCTVSSVVNANRDPELYAQMESSQVVAPDGTPLVWLSKLKGGNTERVCGPDLMPALCERSQQYGYRHYFYGGAKGVAERLVSQLQARYPDLQVAGIDSPPFRPLTEEEDQAVIARLNAAKPDFVWVGLGAPKQDVWISTHQNQLQAPVLLAVGAAFDFHAGEVARAPNWMQRFGLEWIFRLIKEPRRLWRRYFITNTLFVLYLVAASLRLRRYPRK